MELTPFLKIDANLSIHLARPELAPLVFSAVDSQRDYLREWLPWVDSTKELEDTKSFIRESMRHNTNGTRLTTFIVQRGQVIGSVGVVSFSKDNKSCEVGYWLSEDCQGEGIMTKACRVFIHHLFKTKALNRIEIKVAIKNHKSQGIPKRLGFSKEGILREGLLLYGTYIDLVLFSLLQREWAEGQDRQDH